MRGETLRDEHRRVGDYWLIKPLGAGGMGQVWLAEHVETRRQFALKTLNPDAPLEIRNRFEREVAAHARVDSHPNVVRIHHLGHDGGRPWMILDLMTGGSLEDRLRHGPLAAEDLSRLAFELASGLEHLHKHGVLHRDLKPANVLFDEEGRARIADFGLARLGAESGLTATGEILGSPSWMAPEQADGDHRKHSEATDIYGLGAVLYHAATGSPPFRGGSVLSTMNKVLNEAPRPPSELEDGVPPVLDAAILRCLKKSPRQRFASAGRLIEALQADSAPRSGRTGLGAGLLTLLVLLVLVTELACPGTFPVIEARVELPQEVFLDGPSVVIEGRAEAPLGSPVATALNRSAELDADGRFRLEVEPGRKTETVDVVVSALFARASTSVTIVRDRAPPALDLRLEGQSDPLPGRAIELLDTTTTLRITARDRSRALALTIDDDGKDNKPLSLRPGEPFEYRLDLTENFKRSIAITVTDRTGNEIQRRLEISRPQTLLEAFPRQCRREPRAPAVPLPAGLRESWLISASIRIPSTLRLLVPPGVRLRFKRSRIRCNGRLELAGTEAAPILLEPLGVGDFGGIVVDGDDARLAARHTTIRRGGPILVTGQALDVDSDGGGIYAHGRASVELDDCLFESCRIPNRGGAITIMQRGTTLGARRCRFTDNEAVESGGAISIGGGAKAVLEGCLFERNRAKIGAALLLLGYSGKDAPASRALTRVELRSCHFKDNRAGKEGGAVQLYRRARLKATGTRFEGNSSGAIGGAIAIFNNGEDKEGESAKARFDSDVAPDLFAAELDNCDFVANLAGSPPAGGPPVRLGFGGAISAIGPGRIDLRRCRLRGNQAGSYAGAIGISGLHHPRIEDVCRLRNQEKEIAPWQVGPIQQLLLKRHLDDFSDLCDALYFNEKFSPHTRLTLTDCELTKNAAGFSGGAILASLLTRTELIECRLAKNTAALEGGAIAATGESLLGRRGRDWTNTEMLTLPLRPDGALYTTVKVRGGSFSENRAIRGEKSFQSRGGAIALGGGVRLGVFRAEFTGNRASSLGGAIGSHVGQGLIVIDGCRFTANHTNSFGGAIGLAPRRIGPFDVRIRSTEFTGNQANKAGGALGLMRHVRLRMTKSRLTENAAKHAGGLLLSRGPLIYKPARRSMWRSPTLTLSGCTIVRNTVTGRSPNGADVTLSEVVAPLNLREANTIDKCDARAVMSWR